MALFIPVHAPAREVSPAHGDRFTLAELQAFVGGYIQALRAPDGRWIFLNEEGKLIGLPLNVYATVMMQDRLREDDHIVGDVILCTDAEVNNDAE